MKKSLAGLGTLQSIVNDKPSAAKKSQGTKRKEGTTQDDASKKKKKEAVVAKSRTSYSQKSSILSFFSAQQNKPDASSINSAISIANHNSNNNNNNNTNTNNSNPTSTTSITSTITTTTSTNNTDTEDIVLSETVADRDFSEIADINSNLALASNLATICHSDNIKDDQTSIANDGDTDQSSMSQRSESFGDDLETCFVDDSARGINTDEDTMEIDGVAPIPSYYLHNFSLVVESVLSKNKHLFLAEELEMVFRFFKLEETAQRLFIRLYHRKGPWFAVQKLEYREIPDIKTALDILSENGYVDFHDMEQDGISSMAALLSVEQLREALILAKKQQGNRRMSSMNLIVERELLQAVCAKDKQPTLFATVKAEVKQGLSKIEMVVSELAGACVKIAHKPLEIFKRVHSLFFLNQHENPNQVMLMVDFQKIRFPEYSVWGASHLNNVKPKSKLQLSKSSGDDPNELVSVSDSTGPNPLLASGANPTGGAVVTAAPTNANQNILKPDTTDSDSGNTYSLFSTREALLSYETAVVFANNMHNAVAEGSADAALDIMQIAAGYLSQQPPTPKTQFYDFSRRFTAAYVYCSIVTVGISIMESQKRYSEANELLRQQLAREESIGRRGEWWTRLVVNLTHLGRSKEALTTCETALVDPHVKSGDRLKLEKKLVRMCKPPARYSLILPTSLTKLVKEPKKITIRGKKMETGVAGKKSVFRGYDGYGCSVEKFTKQFYSLNDDWEGIHDEGRTMLSIFSLLLWTATFDSTVPHVFQTPYQNSPLDFGTDAFYGARKTQIDELVEAIRSGEAESIIQENWDRNYGSQTRGIEWSSLNIDKLKKIARCAGGETLSKLCRFLAMDFRSLDSGWPDLLLWKDSGETGFRAIKLVEVKGPRDRLSDQQRVVVDILQNCGINVEICKVLEWEQGSKDSNFDDSNLIHLLHLPDV